MHRKNFQQVVNTELTPKEEHFYYNFSIYNNTSSYIPMSKNVEFGTIFINNLSEWNLVIKRFSIPNISSPIFTFATGKYKISLDYNGYSTTQTVILQPRNTDVNEQNNIFEIQHFIDMLNTTLNTAFTALGGLTTLPAGSVAPYFIYNINTKLISLVADLTYYNSALSTPHFSIFLNDVLFFMLRSFPVLDTNIVGKEYQLYFTDVKNNQISGTTYSISQESPSFESISSFAGITILSNVSTVGEFYGESSNQNVLTDFIPTDLNIDTFYNNLVYNPTISDRVLTLTSQNALRNLNIDIYREDYNGNLFKMYLPPGWRATIKFMFIRKN